ncbi:MAG: hypothetical protein OTJ43_09830 [Dehalococcoidia bacterium]|nr:hypothetical protein [Dehalococcoidia bacterium]
MPNTPQNRDTTGRFLAGQSGNPGGRPVGFHSYIQERTADGSELTDFVLSVFRDENASNKERMDAATWLADRGFGKPTVNAAAQAPGIGDFTIVIGDHDARGNPIIPAPRWEA